MLKPRVSTVSPIPGELQTELLRPPGPIRDEVDSFRSNLIARIKSGQLATSDTGGGAVWRIFLKFTWQPARMSA